jgi:hypothetical protein
MKSIRILKVVTMLLVCCFSVFATAEPFTHALDYLAQSNHFEATFAFVFGNPEATAVTANIPALLIQFSQQAERTPRPNNGFLQYAVDDSSLIQGTKVVSPVEGDDPEIVEDPTIFPLELVQSDDDNNEYALSLFASKPQRISDEQQLLVNYALRQMVINRHQKSLEAKIARHILYRWAPTLSSNIIAADGATVTSTLAKWGGTGNRKVASRDNLLDAVGVLRTDDVNDNTYMLIPAGFYNNMLKIADFIDYNKTGRADMLAKGFIGEIAGAKVMTRSTGIIYDAAGNPYKPAQQSGSKLIKVASDVNSAILVWNADHVTKAIGPMEAYLDPKRGDILGSSINFSQRGGGKKRKDEIGVIAIKETAV